MIGICCGRRKSEKCFPVAHNGKKSIRLVILLGFLAGCDNLSLMDYIDARQQVIPGKSSECEITGFTLNEAESQSMGPGVINIEVPSGTFVTSLAPSVSVSPGAALMPPSGSPQNFSGPVLYTVTAEDGVTAKTYLVMVHVAPPAVSIDGVQYNTLQDAVDAAPDGGMVTIITIRRDITSGSAININNKIIGMVSEAPGHSIKRGAKVSGSFVAIAGGGSLTLGDGAAALTIDGGAVWDGGVTGNPGAGSVNGGGPLITVEGGGNLKIMNGVILQNNNNTVRGGGGVDVSAGGYFTMDGGVIKANAAFGAGGGVAVSGGGGFTMNGGVIGENAASGEGGGVALITGGGFIMTGGAISGNRASGAGAGVFVSSGGGAFTMRDGAAVDTNNDVYLGGGKYIDVAGALTADPAGRITPSAYLGGRKALDGLLPGNYGKFSVTPEGGKPWQIDSSGLLAPGP
jgi:hypothetical protein